MKYLVAVVGMMAAGTMKVDEVATVEAVQLARQTPRPKRLVVRSYLGRVAAMKWIAAALLLFVASPLRAAELEWKADSNMDGQLFPSLILATATVRGR